MSNTDFNVDEIYQMNHIDKVPEDDITNMIKMGELNRFNRGNEGLFRQIQKNNEQRRKFV